MEKLIKNRLGWTQEEIGESIGITQKGFAKKFLEQTGKNGKLPISSKNSPSGLPGKKEAAQGAQQAKPQSRQIGVKNHETEILPNN